MKNKQAFTLIELLVVVLIIGILAAVALPQYKVAVAKARAAEAITAMKALSEAEEIYYMTNNRYTADMTELDVTVPDTSTYYTYTCYENSFPSCLAKPKQAGYPVFEFNFQQSSYAGKRWCQVWDTSYRGNQQALRICKAFGTKDPVITHADYYLMQ